MFFKMLGRLIVVAIGFVLAVLTSFVLLTYLGGQVVSGELAAQYGNEIPSGILNVVGFFFFLIELYPAISLLPAILMVVIGEVGRFRSWLFYILMGGWASLMVPLFYIAGQEGQAQLPSAQFLTIFATAGFGGGLVYWLLSGRKA